MAEEQKKYDVHLDIYTDGSFNSDYKVYGGGLVIYIKGVSEAVEMKVNGNDPRVSRHANVGGELQAAMKALELAVNLGSKSITIYHDFTGIHNWTKQKGEKDYWSADKPLTKAYRLLVEQLRDEYEMEINFVHTPGHSGIQGNERADKLAKEAVAECIKSLGTSLQEKQMQL